MGRQFLLRGRELRPTSCLHRTLHNVLAFLSLSTAAIVPLRFCLAQSIPSHVKNFAENCSKSSSTPLKFLHPLILLPSLYYPTFLQFCSSNILQKIHNGIKSRKTRPSAVPPPPNIKFAVESRINPLTVYPVRCTGRGRRKWHL